MRFIFVTLSTPQSPSGWLNAEAPQNIDSIFLTLEVSHALMFSLKDAVDKTQPLYCESPSIQPCRTPNKNDMSVT